jgi:hypothetical protein
MSDTIFRQFQESLEGKSPEEAKENIDEFLRQISERKEQSLNVMETLGPTGTILQRLRRFYRNTVGGDAPIDIVELSQNFYDNIFRRIPMSSQNLGRGILLGLRIGIPLAVTVNYFSDKVPVTVQEETHIPLTSNFNGRGTKVGNRVGINFKKDKVGTYPFQVPVDLSDFFAMVHDFSYMSDSNLDRAWADLQYFSSGIYSEDYLNNLVKYNIVKKEDIPAIIEAYKDKFSKFSLGTAGLLRMTGVTGLAEKLTSAKGLTQKTLGAIVANALRGIGAKLSLRSGIRIRRRDIEDLPPLAIKDFVIGFLPNWKSIIKTTLEAGYRKIYPSDFNDKHNKAVDSMYKYLGSIGQFNQKGIFILKDKDLPKDEILNIYNDFLKDYNDMVSEGDYPTEKVELINKEDTEKYEAVTSAGTTVDRDELEPSGLSLDVVKGWFDFTEKEEDIEFEVEAPEEEDIEFEVEAPEEEDIEFEVEAPEEDIEFDLEEPDIDFELEANDD